MHRDADGEVDGLANFRLPWSAASEQVGALVVEALEATTPTAYRALWALLLDFDLTRTVVAPGRPRDEPLRYMLASPRAMRVTRQSDNLWARILDVKRTLESRTYEAAGELVFAIEDDVMCPANNGAWRLTADDESVDCDKVQAAPQLSIDLAALSALFLGGMSAADLAYAGRIRGADPETIRFLSRMFRIDPEPHNSFGF